MSSTQTNSSKPKKPAKAVVAEAVETKAVATRKSSEATKLDKAAYNKSAWGAPTKLTTRDIVIPKILAMQAMTKAVTEGKAKFGEFRESLSQNLLGDCDSPIEFIPFFRTLEYVVMRKDKKQFKFHRVEPIGDDNEEWEQENDGHEERWYRTTNFYCLLPSEIKEGGALPYLLSFRSTSAKAGSKLSTTMYVKNVRPRGAPPHEETPASTVMVLMGTKKTNDEGTFVVMDVQEKRVSTEEEVACAFTWATAVQEGKTKVDHSDLERDVNTRDAKAAEPVEESENF